MIRATGLHDIVAALGGDLHHGGRTASVPALGHSRADRSVSLLLDQDRVVIHGFGSTGWCEVRAHLVGLGLIDAAGRLTGATTGEVGRASVMPVRPPPRRRMAIAQRVWGEALPLAEGDLCLRYFRHRGLRLRSMPEDLRRHPAAPVSVFRPDSPTCPAMIAAIRAPDDEMRAVEIAYLDPDGRAARRIRLPRKTVGSAPGGGGGSSLAAGGRNGRRRGGCDDALGHGALRSPRLGPAVRRQPGALVAPLGRTPRLDRGGSRPGGRGGGGGALHAFAERGRSGLHPSAACPFRGLERGRGRCSGEGGRAERGAGKAGIGLAEPAGEDP